MARGEGFEPPVAGLEPAGLPINRTPQEMNIITHVS